MFGFLNLDKPVGVTSRHCVDRVLRVVRPLKAGHSGTLDPIASGVLIVAIGTAVRLVEYLLRHPKTYEATFELGKRSDSHDTETEIHEVQGSPLPTVEQIRDRLPVFLGRIEQSPPTYSAVWVGGKRAYELSRRGKPVEVPSRIVEVHALELLGYSAPTLRLRIQCGSGTYVRSLGRDIARSLGTDAIMTELQRTHIGPFSLQNSVPLHDDLDWNLIQSKITDPSHALHGFPGITLTGDERKRIIHGLPIDLTYRSDLEHWNSVSELFAWDEHSRLCSILKPKPDGLWWPHKNFPPEVTEHARIL